MRLSFTFVVITLLGAVALSGCNSAEQANKSAPVAAASPPAAAPADGVRRITVAETRDALARNEAVIVDVRNEASYNAGHIKGARLIPVGDTANRFNELPKDKLIVTYCA
jgi:3-mercaptopyruvate sulfurtransferase SseA